jgi:putative ABC transport system permease protein
VIERYSQALARAEARNYAKQAADEALAREQQAGKEALEREGQARSELEARHAGLAAVLVPVVVGAAALLIALLSYVNARQRREEVGILRAIGLQARQIMVVFLSKAVVIGLLGGVLGVAVGMAVIAGFGGNETQMVSAGEVIRSPAVSTIVVVSLVLAPFLAGLASWVPGLIAARQDPAVVLQGE